MNPSLATSEPTSGTVPPPGAEPALTGGIAPIDDVAEEPPERRRRRILLLLLLLGAFALLLGLAIWYLLFRQPIPLPAIPGQTIMPTYSTAIYGSNAPVGVAATSDGSRIYVGETEGDRTAKVFDGSGKLLGLMEPPVSTGSEHVPIYLAVDPVNGEVYVSDRRTGAIYVYDVNGTYQRAFNPGPMLAGWQPVGMAFDTAGNLYVTEVATQPQILVFDRTGSLTKTLGKTAGLSFPNGLAVDKDGSVYIADSSNGRLIVLDQGDQVVARVGRGVGSGNLGLPRGVAIDGEGRVYVGDATGQGVFVYSTAVAGEDSLNYLGFFGGQGAANGQFEFPNGVAVDARGRVYVTDMGNDRVQMWSY